MSLGVALPLRSTLRREAAFKAAWRHTRLVKFLRIAIPALALIGTLGPILFVFFEPLKSIPADIDIGSLNLDGSKKIGRAHV